MERLLYFVVCANIWIGFSESHQILSSGGMKEWWESTLIYQIYPRSFKDSNGDGYGDLNGILERLDYVKEIGVDTIWIQPFYKSPMADMGYDVADYRAVDPMFGTMDDFKRLLKNSHEKGMKVIVDFVPNHSSDQGEWFKLSEQRIEPFTDFYVWKDGKRINETHTTHPNNWRSVFRGPAWTWSEKRKQYYFHQFAPQQPDLNYYNPRVRREMEDVLRYWLDLGVDGFRVDAVNHLLEAEHYADAPAGIKGGLGVIEGVSMVYMMRQPGNLQLIKSWRAVLDEYVKKDGQARLLSTEAYDMPKILSLQLGNATNPGAQIPFFVRMAWLDYDTTASQLNSYIHEMIESFPARSFNWARDNHDNPRVSTRYYPESVEAWNMLLLLMPGATCIYYGSELGMEDAHVRANQRKDLQNAGGDRTETRDGCRSPMLWDNTRNAGFTTAKNPWLPVHPNYWRTNVEAQRQDPNSHLNIYKRLVELRRMPVIRHGDLRTYVLEEMVFMFTRSFKSDTVAVLMNLGSETEKICVQDSASLLPDTMFVHTRSPNSGMNVGEEVKIRDAGKTECIYMRPQSGLVLSTFLSDPMGSISLSSGAPLSSWSFAVLLLSIYLKIFIS
ncbi:unnamed protein product [Bemisia tabaci]|uniref:alpha-glucosidase n=1 Tax=Bemisia tabaci TaxID=7038 RepID=A0A9P0F8N7_BEMTA|nr:unnamed protein product [Bemisia tabaci]